MKIHYKNLLQNVQTYALSWSLLIFGIVLIFASCKKEPDDNNNIIPVVPPKSSAIYVLNQGSFSSNNASVTLYNLEDQSISPDYFKSQNNRELGDTGSDMCIYGSKVYIVTNVSSQLEIVDAVTFKSIKQIPFFNEQVPQQPSAVTAYEGKVYVCAYDGTVTVFDTTTLEPIKVIKVGLNPDAILAAYGKIWVSNSGGLNFPDYDKTVSVIDPVTLTETKKIETGLDPYTLQADSYGDIYVISRGNYSDVKMRLQIIDAATQKVKHTFEDFEAMNFTIKGDTAYVYNYDYFGSNGSSIMMINVKTEEVITSNFITDGSVIETVYSIAVDPNSNDVFIGDAKGFVNQGMVHCYSNDGKLKYSFKAGINPVAIKFLVK
ncbi:MAG: YncE family protein [Lentimicrobiaceae bacterium]